MTGLLRASIILVAKRLLSSKPYNSWGFSAPPIFVGVVITTNVMPNGSHVNVAYLRTMTNITWEHYTPYSIGFDETFSRLEALAGGGSNYPPYNVVDGSDGRTLLEVALAGFAGEDIEVETERNVLTVSARKAPPDKERKYSHKGISYRTFSSQLADGR
jgi:molecular chaperone IbpA